MKYNILNFNGTPYLLLRKVWFGKFIDNLNGGQVRQDLIDLWKEYTEADQIYQEGETLFFLQEIKEIKFTEII